MTITNPNVVKELLRNNGRDLSEPSQVPFSLIYRYRNVTDDGKWLFALFINSDHDDMDSSPFVLDYECLMANCILTKEGQAFLNS